MVERLLDTLFGPDCTLGHRPNGAPFLPDRSDSISIAHTHRFAVVLTHPQKQVGVDIEYLGRDFSAVENKALSTIEQEYLSSEHRSLQLAIIWSAKEAIYKYLSKEGVDFSRQITIEKFLPNASGRLQAQFLEDDGKIFSILVNYKIVENHILTYIIK